MIMMQAAQEEEVMTSKDQSHVMKGKRTKRQRPLSPALALAVVSSTSSSAAESESGGGERFSDNSGVGVGVDRVMRAASPTTSLEFSTSSEEEEDMANCLILLAQGNSNKKKLSPSSPSEPSANVIATTSNNKVAAGLYLYQCKTCNRCFPSFQALGGHRASHKKPKASVNEEKKTLMVIEEDKDHHRFNSMSTTLSLQIANRTAVAFAGNSNSSSINKTNKVHECSICGAEFSSGQALGGHMRRHRAFMNTTTTTTTMTAAATTGLSMAASGSLDHHHQSREAKKPRNILQLDLNLPAPEDDRRESKFAFASQEQVIVFSASSLVDCHY